MENHQVTVAAYACLSHHKWTSSGLVSRCGD